MAKPRKQKSEEQKTDNNKSYEAVVRHQKICLSIDMDKRLVYGYTELQIEVPDNGIVALHADNLVIEAVTVDGEPARSEVFPHYVPLDSENRWCGVSSAASAADAAGSVYLSTLERELVPNLLIMCPKSDVSASGQQEKSENGLNSSEKIKQNVRLVRVDYWVEKAETGIHFENDVLHTDNQIRRARCWFPCMDDSSQSCCYDLEFTVAENFVAVSSGNLLYQILSQDGLRKTYVYKVNVPVTSRWISLAVAPFEIISDSHTGVLSYICMRGSLEKLQNTVGFFHSAFSYYEEYLSTSFPFGTYTQVFLSPEMVISSMSLGVSMTIFSSQYLFDEKVIDQTIDTRIKLAFALARQWFGVYVSSEEPSDDWLLDGLAWFLTDLFIKQFLGNNEARYRRYKANSAVSKADDSGATTLSSPASSVNLYGTQSIGFYGKMRSWKSVAVLQMLEKQMGPESFRKILQNIVSRAQDSTRPLRTLSTTEFRHLANKVGNLERPFLKEFFPRWVGSCGCPVLRMGFSYNKRKNLVELAAMRGCTAATSADSITTVANGKNTDTENREGNAGWPGMMSIRVHELDGMYDHPILPMAGEALQLLEMQCHSKLASKRFQKPKKGSKLDGSDENGDIVSAIDVRSNSDSTLLWLRADPEMEFLAEINFNQPVQMWINQLEKDKDVVAQSQAISMLETLPQLSFSVVNALSNFLGDAKAFWRVRIEAAFALAITASEETDWAGLLHLIKFYKSRRFDVNIGLPKPNDFHDFPEYFLLEAIPNAVAMVRAADKKSPREAVEFVLHLLKYNDNNGNPYSDVFWLGSLVQSIGELEFGQQSLPFLSSLLKRIDRILQFDRLMPSYNGILTISCIRSLTQVALKLYKFIPLDRVIELIRPFRDLKIMWQVRIEASKALLDLEFHCKGFDGVLALFVSFIEEEPTLRGQVKMGVHVTRLCQMRSGSHSVDDIKSETLKSLLCLLESSLAFNNVILRHYLFCVLQVLAGRPPTLYGIPRNETTQMGHAEMINFFAALMNQPKDFDSMVHDPNSSDMGFTEDFPYTSMVDPIADVSNILTQEEPIAGIVDLTPDPTQNVPGLLHKDPDADLTNNLSQKEPVSIADLSDDQPAPIADLSDDLSEKEPAPIADLSDDLSQKEPALTADLSDDLSQKEPLPTANLSDDLSQKEPLPTANLSDDLPQKEALPVAAKEAPPAADLSNNLSQEEPAPTAALSNNLSLEEPAPTADQSNNLSQEEQASTADLSTNLSPKEAAPTADLSTNLSAKEPAPIANLSTNLTQKDPAPTPNLPNTFLQHKTVGDIVILEPKPKQNVPETLNPTLSEPSLKAFNESKEGLVIPKGIVNPEAPKDPISNNHEKRRVLKIKVRQSAASSRAEDADNNPTIERSRGGLNDAGPVASSSVSVDAPMKIFTEAMSVSNQNIEEVNSCHDPGSRMTASIGSAKLADELGKELQCTADSSNTLKDNGGVKTQKYASLQSLSVIEKEKKKGKEKKRKRDKDKSHRDDPEYREKKRLKKEKKQMEKEMAKLLNSAKVKLETELSKGREEVKKDEIGTRLKLVSKDVGKDAKQAPIELTRVKEQEQVRRGNIDLKQRVSGGPKVIIKMADSRPDPSEASSSHKFRIKIKKRTPNQE